MQADQGTYRPGNQVRQFEFSTFDCQYSEYMYIYHLQCMLHYVSNFHTNIGIMLLHGTDTCKKHDNKITIAWYMKYIILKENCSISIKSVFSKVHAFN